MNDAQIGSLAGFIATAPMTLAMDVMHRNLPQVQKYPLPPRQIAMNLAKRARARHDLESSQRFATTMLAHFSFGTGAGAIYGALSRRIPLSPVVSGMAYGLAVWASNYLVIMPAYRLLRPATQHPPQRVGLMIAAHLIWGAVSGFLTARLQKEADGNGRRRSTPKVSAAAQWDDRRPIPPMLAERPSPAETLDNTPPYTPDITAEIEDQEPFRRL